MNYLKEVILFGLIITFSPNISLSEVPTKITASVSKEKSCLGCHEGIEEIREPGSIMLMQAKIIGKVNGDPNGCVTCHGGNPKGLTGKESHLGAPKIWPMELDQKHSILILAQSGLLAELVVNVTLAILTD